ncbi:Tumor necrosis factor alpha-induced protein 3 [Mizuhopecten yessoensis]|uniref:Tumor necrosis factor alpha-induced protein 3 n=2 Tax=Mizuhopecten yessoensis TaxID=6573 RepID=A0A210R2I7_MIZYE|nr:Tumor necrosis factor alpha-induced protein 3 [Mizuhopecten yessoensis]
MDRPTILFRKKFSETSPELVRKLRDRIRGDVHIASFRHFQKFTVCLPALYLFQSEFKQQYIISVCDLDMKNDLKTAKVINWCNGVKNLYPITTTGDGNCLVHAVSLALWGIEDSEQFLRTLLYLTLSEVDASLSNGMSSKIQHRWKYVQDEIKKQHPREFNYDITSLDLRSEWDNVVRAAGDVLEPGTQTAGTPYPSLEGVHIFALANLLKRPIIVLAERTVRSVYGNSMQENCLFGIYLPLEVKHSDVCKTPIILGYSLNHFAPLVTQANSPDGEGSSQSILPLIMEDYTTLPVRFLLREEEHKAADLMKKYMYVKNIPRFSDESINSIPGVVLQHQSIHDELDIVSMHRRECERIFLNMQKSISGKVVVCASERVPTSTTRLINPSTPQARHDRNQRTKQPISNPTSRDPELCITSGCTMFGSPATAHMCSACFTKYTVEFGKQEAQLHGRNLPNEPSAPPLTLSGQESYTDLSVMGINCSNLKCGNRCSEKTYPYCHECNPQTQGSELAQPVAGARASAPPNIAVMEMKCRNPKCDNHCSTQTHPFCHECKDFFISQGVYFTAMQRHLPAIATHGDITSAPGLAEAPAALGNSALQPPEGMNFSFMKDQRCKNTVQCVNLCTTSTYPFCPTCSQQLNEVSNTLPSKPASYPQGPPIREITGSSATAVRQNEEPVVQSHGAEGIDENSLFGEGDQVPPNRELGKLDIAPSALSVEEFEEVHSLSGNFVFSPGPSSQTHVVQSAIKTPNKSSSVGTPSPQESGQRLPYPEAGGHQQISVQSSGSSYAIIRERTFSQENNAGPSQGQGQRQPPVSPESPEFLKQLCSTPGCHGVRLVNNFGYCMDCWTRCIKGVEVHGPVIPESTIESTSPQLNTSEIRSMNPIVTTSKDKKDCASPLCNKKIYPPNKLCDSCIEVLRQGQTRSLEEQPSPRREKKGKSYSPSRPKCKKENCDFHGSKKTNGYCSRCYKEVARVPIEAKFKQTPTLSNLTPHNRTVEPPRTYNNAPVTQGGVPPMIQSQHCLEPGCDKYGDPNMCFRCTEHYRIASSGFQPQPPPSNMYSAGEVMKYNLAENQPLYNMPGQPPLQTNPVLGLPNEGYMNNLSKPQSSPATSQNAAFQTAMSNVENNLKNRVLCKTDGCQNIGSGMRRGYCSECYPYSLQRRGQDTPQGLSADDPRMNSGCC